MGRLIGIEYTPRSPSADNKRRLTLNADFDQALLRLAAARLQYEELAAHGGSFAARLDALDHLVVLRTDIRNLRTGAGLEL